MKILSRIATMIWNNIALNLRGKSLKIELLPTPDYSADAKLLYYDGETSG